MTEYYTEDMKYRIKEAIRKDINSYYQIQRRFLFIWMDVKRPLGTYYFPTLPQAQASLEQIRSQKVIGIKYHY